MKRFKPSKTIFNQLVVTTLISSFLLTTACNSDKGVVPFKPYVVVEKHIKKMQAKMLEIEAAAPTGKLPADILEIQEELKKMQEELLKTQKEQGKLTKTQVQVEAKKMQEELEKMQEKLSKAQKTQNNSAEEENFKETQDNLVTKKTEKEEVEETKNTQYGNDQPRESRSCTSAITIELSPNHTAPRTIILKIDNITDSDGKIRDEVKARFLDVTDIKDYKSHIRAISPNAGCNIGSEIEINEKSRQVRLNIAYTKDIHKTSDDDGCIIRVQINLTAYSSFDTEYNKIKQKISIPLDINNIDMVIDTHTTDGQPCNNIKINNWNEIKIIDKKINAN